VAPVRAEAVEACERLLASAAEAESIRGDVTPDDIRLLLIGTRAAERVSPGAAERLLELTLDGLRA
jgi:hypothetical protein